MNPIPLRLAVTTNFYFSDLYSVFRLSTCFSSLKMPFPFFDNFFFQFLSKKIINWIRTCDPLETL